MLENPAPLVEILFPMTISSMERSSHVTSSPDRPLPLNTKKSPWNVCILSNNPYYM